MTTRLISDIAREIEADWGSKVHYTAAPYLNAMFFLDNVSSAYYHDDAKGIILRFLSNSNTWRGETARRIKAELKAMIK